MPVKNKNVQIEFGSGDISVRIGCMSDGSFGAVQFVEIDPLPIGEHVKADEKSKIGIDDAPVTFIFNKIESLDVVIYQLQKLRDKMDDKVNKEKATQ